MGGFRQALLLYIMPGWQRRWLLDLGPKFT